MLIARGHVLSSLSREIRKSGAATQGARLVTFYVRWSRCGVSRARPGDGFEAGGVVSGIFGHCGTR